MRASSAVVVLLALATATALLPPSGADHPQSSGGRPLSFDHKGGNEWWVEARLGGASASSVARVEAMDTGGAWKALTLRSWGNWAASFHVEPGHLVRFRATFPDGAHVASCEFTHPTGVERCDSTPPPPSPSGFDAAFRGVRGNAWWVEAKVSANAPLAGVDARVQGGEWRALTLRSWGAWAASFSIPEGSLVQLRARATDGATDLSGHYAWPSATPVAEAQPWPREGSFLRYLHVEGEHSPGGNWAQWSEVNVTLRYKAGAWDAECEGWRDEWHESHDESGVPQRVHSPRERILAKAGAVLPLGPTDARAGERVTLGVVHACGASLASVVVQGPGAANATRHGQNVQADAWLAAGESPDCPCWHDRGAWHRTLGVLLDYSWTGRSSGWSVALVDTDAPLARGDPAPLPAPAPAWPKEGSFVAYEAHPRSTDAWYPYDQRVAVRLTYREGAWDGVCTVETQRHASSEQAAGAETRTEVGPSLPLRGPVHVVRVRDLVEVPGMGACWTGGPPNVVRGAYPEATGRDGQPVRTTAWWADEEGTPDPMQDSDVWWDADTGLVLRWEWREGAYSMQGRLTDTDAPLG